MMDGRFVPVTRVASLVYVHSVADGRRFVNSQFAIGEIVFRTKHRCSPEKKSKKGCFLDSSSGLWRICTIEGVT